MKSASTLHILLLSLAGLLLLAACGGLSDREKQMVGKYYIPAVSDTNPLMELNRHTLEDGDPGLVGHVTRRVAYPIRSFNESTLTIERQGINYDYHRRAE